MSNIYPVIEIFKSFQGEGREIGKEVIFLRLAGCNLKCPWCDTKESWSVKNSRKMTITEIIDECLALGVKRIVITGGEPTIYNLDMLSKELWEAGFTLSLETNGINYFNRQYFNYVAVSPKPPHYIINDDISYNDIKLVIDENITEEIFLEILDKTNIAQLIYLQPEGTNPIKSLERIKKLFEIPLSKNLSSRIRLGIQAHKYWGVL